MKEQYKILVVEDEIVTGMEIRDRLIKLGFGIAGEASTGDEAIRIAEESRPDLVLMDIRLKGEIDGVEAATRINEKFVLPIIYITAYSDMATLERAKLTEPYGYLLKPFADKDLYTAIDLTLYRHRMEKKLKESERWFSTTLNCIGDGVIATDANGFIKFMNPVAEALTTWKENVALGKHLGEVFQIINDSDGGSVENPGIKALETGESVAIANHTLLITKDGEKIAIDDNAAPIQDDKGNLLGAVLVFRDITERKRAEKAREQLILQLKNTIAEFSK